MKKLIALTAVAVSLATSASAATLGWGFKSVTGVADMATEILWQGGGVRLIETDTTLTLDIQGLDNLVGSIEAWVVDWSMPMGQWNTFDVYLNPPFNSHCGILVNPIMYNWDSSNQPFMWDQANGARNGYCGSGVNEATLTANIATMPLPAGALLLLSGVAGLGIARKRVKQA